MSNTILIIQVIIGVLTLFVGLLPTQKEIRKPIDQDPQRSLTMWGWILDIICVIIVGLLITTFFIQKSIDNEKANTEKDLKDQNQLLLTTVQECNSQIRIHRIESDSQNMDLQRSISAKNGFSEKPVLDLFMPISSNPVLDKKDDYYIFKAYIGCANNYSAKNISDRCILITAYPDKIVGYQTENWNAYSQILTPANRAGQRYYSIAEEVRMNPDTSGGKSQQTSYMALEIRYTDLAGNPQDHFFNIYTLDFKKSNQEIHEVGRFDFNRISAYLKANKVI